MSEISVTVNGSTTINPTVGNGDVVNVTFSAAGERGPKGDTGATGPANQLTIGTVVTGPDAAATLSKQTVTNGVASQTLDLTLPQGATGAQGPQGPTGPAGPPNTLTIGTVTKGDTASATLSSQTIAGGSATQTLDLVLPKGDKGDIGAAGPFTTIQVGTTTTGAAGTSAKVDTITAGDTVTLNFTVPRGYDGTSNLGDEIPQPLGTASAGSATVAARADHVHALPTIAYNKLTGVPTTFAPAAHTHAISEVTNLQSVLDSKQAAGNYATLVNGLVPSSQLPGFVDDVSEFTDLAAFPATGEVGKLFVARDTNKVYRWSGTTYIEIAASPGSTDAVPEGSANLYFTTGRAAAAAPVQSVNGKTGDVTIEAGGIAWSTAPTTTTTTTKAGQLSYDDNYVYVATAVDTWRRAGLEDWSTPTITITTQPSNQTAVGNAATFTVQATASQNAELLYQWQRQAGGTGGWVDIATGLSATLSLADLSYAANNGDKYRVVITSGAAGTGGTAVNGWLPAVVVELTPTATVTSGEAVLTVAAAISIVTHPQSVTLTSDTSASFSLSATTPGTGLSYQWQSSPDGTNWTNISGATSASLSLTGITQTAYDGLRYRCVVSSSGYDDATSNAAILSVAPITVTTQPASKTATPVSGATEPTYTASFSVAGASPAGPPSLQWQVSTDAGATWSDVSGATSASLSLSALTWSDTGKRYRARLNKTGWNEVASNAAILTVPTDTIAVTQQPANTTATVSQFSSQGFTLPSGTWGAVSYANGSYFVSPSNDDLGGDYIATSGDGITWTKRAAVLPEAAAWSGVVYGDGLYLTLRPGTQQYARSTNGIDWTAATLPATAFALRRVDGLGWMADNPGGYRISTDGISWSGNGNWPSSYDSPYVAGQYVVVFVTNGAFTPNTPRYAAITGGSLSSFAATGGLQVNDRAVASNGSTVLFASGNSARIINFAQSDTAQAAGTASDASDIVAAAYHAPSGRWVIVAKSSWFSGGIYTSNGTSIAKRLPLSLSGPYALSRVFVNGTRILAWIADSTVPSENGWYTSDDGGLTWTYRGGPPTGPFAATQVGSRFVVQSSEWNNTSADTGVIVDAGGLVSAQFSAAATTLFGTPSVQWQVSTDAGANWSDVSGATSPTLSLTPATADSGKRYRARFTKSQYTAVNSNAAILTVP